MAISDSDAMGMATRAAAFKRKFWLSTILCVFGFLGLSAGLIYLDRQPDYVISEEITHGTCVHAECRVPHTGVDTSIGAGGGGLCAFYLLSSALGCFLIAIAEV